MKTKWKWKSLNCVWLLMTPWTVYLRGSSVQGILQARIMEWIAVPFSRISPWPRDQTGVSCIAGEFFTSWATREAWRPNISFQLKISRRYSSPMQKNKNTNKTLVVIPTSSCKRLAPQSRVPARGCVPAGEVRGTGQSLPLKVEVEWQKIRD